MPKRWIITLVAVFQLIFSSNAMAADRGVPIICYHDVGGNINNEYTVTKETLISHLSYLKANGYHPISLEQYIAFTKDGAPLPEKPVMLTFDDGYISFYNEVFPLLKQYNYPAILAIVGSWLDYAPADVGKLVSWQQIREMDASGLVTIASHSFRSHRFTIMNPQGDRGELLATRTYTNDHYESMEEYTKRVSDDLEQSQKVFEKELGHKVQALVWPYGEYNLTAIEIAKNKGFESMFALGGGMNEVGQKSLVEARRGIIMKNPTVSSFASFVMSGGLDNNPMRAARLDIDAIYDSSSLRTTDNNLNLAIARFNKTGINTVFLRAFTNENKDIESAYFYTTVMPVKADIFSHIASKLREGGFLVYAVMPDLSSQWLTKEHPEDGFIVSDVQNNIRYTRATPFSPIVQKKLVELYADLAAYTYVDGVLFQDDLYPTTTEDFSSAAKATFQSKFNKELTAEVLKDESTRSQWKKVQKEAVQNLTSQMLKAVHAYRPYALFAQSISGGDLLNKDYNQDHGSYLDSYNYTVIRAYPFSQKQNGDYLQWLGKIAETTLVNSETKFVFELETFDNNKNLWIKEKDLKAQMDMLRSKGAIHFSFIPDILFEDKTVRIP